MYVYVDGDKKFWNRSAVENLALKYIEALKAFQASAPDLNEEMERFNVEEDLLPSWRHAKPALDRQIERAIERYEALIQEARGEGR